LALATGYMRARRCGAGKKAWTHLHQKMSAPLYHGTIIIVGHRIITLSSTVHSNKSMPNTYSSNHFFNFQRSAVTLSKIFFISQDTNNNSYSHILPGPTILCLINISHPATLHQNFEHSLSLFVIRTECLLADVKCYCES
jgi:hypothetical protein